MRTTDERHCTCSCRGKELAQNENYYHYACMRAEHDKRRAEKLSSATEVMGHNGWVYCEAGRADRPLRVRRCCDAFPLRRMWRRRVYDLRSQHEGRVCVQEVCRGENSTMRVVVAVLLCAGLALCLGCPRPSVSEIPMLR